MGTDYIRRLREQGRYDPTKWRAERERRELAALLEAWSRARESVRAEFMASVGLVPAPEPVEGP